MPGIFGEQPNSVMPSLFAPPPSSPGGELREFTDAGATRRIIYQNVLKEAKALPPVQNKLHTLKLVDVDYEDPDEYSLKRQKQAILRGETLARRLRGTWQLLDNNDGKVLDERKMTIAQVPHMTPRGTFIINGSEYSLAQQLRLRPGVFTRVKESGEAESHINVLPGNGISHRIHLDPESGVFSLNVAQSKVPLVSLLRAMGVKDNELQQAWGSDLFSANIKKSDPRAIDKLYAKLVRNPPGERSPEEKVKTVADLFLAMRLDPEVTARTLGKPLDKVSPESILASTRRLLAVHKGEEEPDDRDSLAFQTLLGPEDLISERVKTAARVLRPLLWKTTFNKNLSRIQPGFLNKHVLGAITSSGLGQSLEEVNFADVYDQMTRVTRMGDGGIPDSTSVPDEARAVQPSHYGFIDYLRTPESEKAGVDLRLASSARKGQDGRIYSLLKDAKTGKSSYLSPQDIADKVLAFPGEMDSGKKYVKALQGGKIRFVARGAVDYSVPEAEHALNQLSNLVPGKSGVYGQREVMGSRMMAQALPLVNAEAPLVQSKVPGEEGSYEEKYGKMMGAVHASQPGRVVSVSPDEIRVKYADGEVQTHELYNNFALNRKTGIHSTPLVMPGQEVTPGQILAKSNFTNDQGAMAAGLNLRTAYTSWKGLNFEDAKLISESAAKKLSSEHLYQHDLEWDDNVRRGKKAFVSVFPSVFDRKTLEAMDDDGIVKPGTVVREGDPLVLVARERERAHNQISRSKDSSFKDASSLWEHSSPGVVADVEKTKNGVVVTVKSIHEMKTGDKLSGRYGDKGVVHILPDDQMPRDANGMPFEVIENSQGIISRKNPFQVPEAVLGKIAAKTGIPYKIDDFRSKDLIDFAEKELAKHGMSDLEDIIDPETGRKIPGVLTGQRYYMKLHHMSEQKGQGRGVGGYTGEELPAKASEDSSKRMSMMDVNSILSSSSTEVLRDAGAIRGQKNLDWWAAYMSGKTPPEPRVPLVYKKFFDSLRASGINPVREGGQIQIMAMTNKDVDKLAGNRFLENAETVNWKEGLKPIAGGLFSSELTGGHGSTRWSAIKLHEPMLNPVMEQPARTLLGLTEKGFEDILSGKEALHGRKGPAAIAHALQRIDVDQQLAQARQEIAGSKKTARDKAIKKLTILKGVKNTGVHPGEWVLDKVPVLPPLFRPVSVMAGNGLPLVSDPNLLYKEVFEANDNLKHMTGQTEDVGEERLALYKAFKGVTGLGDPITAKNQERRVKGILQGVFGGSSKYGAVQRKLLGSQVDLVGRAVALPNPDLDMDQVGIPEEKAWNVYKPFIVRRLARRGVPPLDAAQMVQDRKPLAREALLKETEERPVLITRAPVLHRYGMMAFWPKLVQGDAIQANPLMVRGAALDFDGDQMNYHVPVSDEAVKDAIEKMLPSRNLLSTKDFRPHYLPVNEYLGGLYTASTVVDDKKPEQVFHTKADAIRAYKRGEISADTRVVIMSH